MSQKNKPSFSDNSLIRLKDSNWLAKQRVAGKVAANTISLLQNEVNNKTKKTLIELNELAENFILKHPGCLPTFKGYQGFPAGVCISVNKQLVHGIPTSYVLQEGDIVSFDLGVTFEGAIADTAITMIYGEAKFEKHKHLIKTTEEALMKAISTISVGKKLGCIGYAIYKHIKNNGYEVITNYGGHGIDTADDGVGIPHAQPFVSNKANFNEGITIQKGLVIAIEPMAIVGDNYTFVDKDNWTVYGRDISAHFEHSIYIHEDHAEIITARN